MLVSPYEGVETFVVAKGCREISYVYPVDFIDLIPSREQLDSTFSFRGMVEKCIRMWFENLPLCLVLASDSSEED